MRWNGLHGATLVAFSGEGSTLGLVLSPAAACEIECHKMAYVSVPLYMRWDASC